MAGPLLLIFIVIYLTHKINELDTDREVMINSWKNIEIMEKKVKKWKYIASGEDTGYSYRKLQVDLIRYDLEEKYCGAF